MGFLRSRVYKPVFISGFYVRGRERPLVGCVSGEGNRFSEGR